MGIFRRVVNLSKGMWKVKRSPDPAFDAALEKELAHVVTEEEKARARARLHQLKSGESEDLHVDEADAETEEAPKPPKPPKKTL